MSTFVDIDKERNPGVDFGKDFLVAVFVAIL